MAGHPYVNQVRDLPTRKALTDAFDLANKIQSDLAALTTQVTDLSQLVTPTTPTNQSPLAPPLAPGLGGGPSFGSFVVGDLLVALAADDVGGLLDVPDGNVLLSGGVTAPPKWGKANLTQHVVGTLPLANGGTAQAAALSIPGVYANGRSAGAIAAVASVTTFTVGAADASFQVSANVLVTTATAHAFTVTCAYTDEGGTARTLTLSFTLVAGGGFTTAIVNANGAVPYMGIPQHLRCKAATAITIATVGVFTTVVYNVEGRIISL